MSSEARLPGGPELETGPQWKASARQWLAIAGAWLLYSLLKVALLQATPKSGTSWGWYSGVIVLAMGLYWTLATPLVFSLARRLRPDRVGLGRALAGHAVAAVGLAVGVTLLQRFVMHLLWPQEPVRILVPFVAMLDYHVITYAMLAVFGSAFDRYREYTLSRRRTLTLFTQLAEARLQFLQRQIQPHFLFNALNTVAELARESPAIARRTLLDLSRLLRSAIDHADRPEVTLREELATLEPFLQIQRLRFCDSLDIRCDVSSEALDAHVPPMLLQPLIENAVRHGRTGRGERGRVLIAARVVTGRLLLKVEDDGPRSSLPVVATRLRSGHGIGLRNTTERLAQLYGEDHTFDLRTGRDGTMIAKLDLPYRVSPAHHPASLDEARPSDVLHGRVQPGPSQGEFRATVPLQADRGAPADSLDAAMDVDARSAPRLSPRAWALMVLVWVGAAAYWMTQAWVVERLSMGKSPRWTVGLIDLVSAIVWAALTPVVLWLARTVRLQRGRVIPALLFHFVAAFVIATIHLEICFRSGVDDRPLLLPVNVNPFTLDLCIYFALLAWSHARDFTAWYTARAIAAARTEAAIARSRVDATAISLHAPFMLGVLSSAAALAVVDPARTERVVERLGDLLRTVLQSVGQGARTVGEEVLLLEQCLGVHEELAGTYTEVHAHVDADALGAYVPPGVVHAVMDYIVARGLSLPAAPLRVDVDAAGVGLARELVFHVKPLTPARVAGARMSYGHFD
jgi:two-component system LytT family sensor kinase